MKKVYNSPCVDVLVIATSSVLCTSPGDGDSDGRPDLPFGGGPEEGTENPELTGGYREWGNIWGN